MEFKKIKLTKDGGLEIHYKGYTRAGAQSYGQEVILVSEMPPHKDLINAFEKLNFFLAELCEQHDCVVESTMSVSAAAELEQSDVTQRVECRGVTLGGSDEHSGICLVGRRKLEGKRILNLVSPFRKWEDPNDEYLRAWELRNAYQTLEDEAGEYLKGKYAPNPQGDLFMDQEPENEDND